MSAPGAHRLFVAIAVPEAVKSALIRMQRELRELLSPRAASWTKPQNMHLTLRFLGNVDESRIQELLENLHAAVAGFGAMPLVCERLGCFPDLRFPRVVWAWVHDSAERLNVLAKRVDEACCPFAEKPAESRFTGHITIARPRPLRRPESTRLADYIKSASEHQFGTWPAGELELIASELSREGSRYTTLATFPLNAIESE